MSDRTDLIEQIQADEADFEKIRLTLINELAEPARTAFWMAVTGRDRAREAIAALRAGAGVELDIDEQSSILSPGGRALARAAEGILRASALSQPAQSASRDEVIDADCHGLDTPERVCFYEQDFYVLSNFSAFNLVNRVNLHFDTSEAAYQWEKFAPSEGYAGARHIADHIRAAKSAHDAFKHAENFKHLRRPDWDDVKIDIMRDILRAKADQHEYVNRKLEATGDRELVENSWRDDFWGWGPNRDGKNMLGKLWMEIRAERRALKDGGRTNVGGRQP